jgi:hypothetical protein
VTTDHPPAGPAPVAHPGPNTEPERDANPEVPVIQGVAEAAVIRPGDTLLLVARPDMSDEDVDHLARGVQDHLAGVHTVVVDCVEQALVYRPDELTGDRPGKAT